MKQFKKHILFLTGCFVLCYFLLMPVETMAASKSAIKLNRKSATLYISGSKTIQLKATVTGKSKKVSWKSSKPSVASVNSKGKVTAKKAGTATITAKANGVSAKCKITVKKSKKQSVKSIYDKAASYYKKGSFKKAEQYFKKLDKNADEACIRKMSKAMKKAYLKVLKSEVRKGNAAAMPDGSPSQKMYGVNRYYLTDIDKDGKPELLIEYDSGCMWAQCMVYSYKGGKLKKIGWFHTGHCSIYYDPRGNGLTVRYGMMGGEVVYTVKIVSGRIKEGKQWNDRTGVTSNYTYIPFALNSYISYGKQGYQVDYSPLQ